MIVVAHPLGNACVRALLAGLEEEGMLARFLTTLAFHAGDRWIRSLPPALRRQLERRRYDLPAALMRRWPWREMARLGAGATGLSRWGVAGRGWAGVDAVFQALDRRGAAELSRIDGARGVYAYEDGALELFRAAERLGWARCYELPMGYWREARRIFQEEAGLQPEWAPTLDGLRDGPAKLARKDEELAAASHIVVASAFARGTLAAHPSRLDAPVSVVPHGGPEPVLELELKERLRSRPAGPIRVLFVGGLTQRKGLSYLFDAMKLVGGQATLTVVGRASGGPRCAALERGLRPHRHVGTLPPVELMALMRRHDVLVLPSLFEGFGLVLLEAMAQGLPVIATPHTAAPELLAGGEAGQVVPIRSAAAIAEEIGRLAAEPALRESMALAARGVAHRSTWANQRRLLLAACRAALAGGPAGNGGR